MTGMNKLYAIKARMISILLLFSFINLSFILIFYLTLFYHYYARKTYIQNISCDAFTIFFQLKYTSKTIT